MNSIDNVVFEHINDNICYGIYGEYKIIIDIRGYINATHLCSMATSKNGNKKELSWKQTVSAQELIKEVALSRGISCDDLMMTSADLSYDVRGTYVRPDLIPHIASWADPKFAVNVSRIIDKYMINRSLAEKNSIISEQKSRIDELIVRTDSQSLQIREQTMQLSEQTTRINQQSLQIQELSDLNHELRQQNMELVDGAVDMDDICETIHNQISSISKKLLNTFSRGYMKLSPDEHETEAIYIYARVYKRSQLEINEEYRNEDEFKVLRRQEHALTLGRRALAKEGYIEYIAHIDPTPNAFLIWSRMRSILES